MIDFKNAQIEIYPYNSNTYTILVKNKAKANKLNRLLKTYDETIQEGEEPIFRVKASMINNVLVELGLKSLRVG